MLDFYVYLHRRKDNNQVFYVGKGRLDRHKRSRAYKTWKSVVDEAGGFISEIIRTNLSEAEALDLERTLISNPEPNWKLINKSLSNRRIDIDYSIVSKYVYYDPTSPSGLRHSFTKGPVLKDDVAGNLKVVDGRPESWSVKIKGKLYTCARVVWVLNNKEIDPSLVIDHIDRNVSNNHISNLRLVTTLENNLNKSTNRNHSTGIDGVHFYSHNGYEYYTVYRKTKKLKYFSIKKYGKEEALRLAIEYLSESF